MKCADNYRLTNKIFLKDLSLDQLEELVVDMGEKKFRARQIASWLYRKGVSCIDEMTDLPAHFRGILKEKSFPLGLTIIKKQLSNKDNTRKYLFRLVDGNAVEGVLMTYKHGLTACVSTQVGCKMKCSICASGIDGLIRNLTPGEIYDQVILMQNEAGGRVTNIVLMGSGEPLDNYDNVMSFIEKVNAPYGLNIGYRHITLSTCGIVPGIMKLCAEKKPITLAVSLHAPDDKLRNFLVPINRKYPLKELFPVCHNYVLETGRRITFEYALIKNINDSPEQAIELTRKLKNMLCLVNLIPANPVIETGFFRSPKDNILRFKKVLVENGLNVTLRRELGSDIDAACGQLRRNVFNREIF